MMAYTPILNIPGAFKLGKGCCGGCPFLDGITEEATMTQNYGCLPDKFDIVNNNAEHGQVWACHSKPDKVCTGLKNYLASKGLPVPDNPTSGETFGEWARRDDVGRT